MTPDKPDATCANPECACHNPGVLWLVWDQPIPAWQKCPVCEGTGVEWPASQLSDPCHKCKGECVIRISDGQPPSDGSGA